MKSEFRIVASMKKFIFELNDILVNFPKKEKELGDSLKKNCFECLELIFFANNVSDRLMLQKKIMSKISMIDFLIEYAYKMKYISEKQALRKSHELNVITKMLYGWINEQQRNKTS
jgi:hypothetical protein